MKTIIALSISFNILLLVSLFDTSPAKQAAELAANPVTSDEGLITAITNNSQTDIQHSISEQRHKPFINTGPAVADNEASPRPPKLPDSRYTGIDFEALYKKIDSKPRNWVSFGDSEKVLYVFHDAMCPSCSKAKNYLEQIANRNEAEIRFLPVGMLGVKSSAMGSIILSPDDQASRQELLMLIDDFNAAKMAVEKSVTKELADNSMQRVAENSSVLADIPGHGTPMFAFVTGHGAQFTFLSPESIDGAIASIIPLD